MAETSYGKIMQDQAESHPEETAIIIVSDGEIVESRTRSKLVEQARSLARAYADMGVGPGDLVTISIPNGCEHYEATLACWFLGATPNPVSTNLPAVERLAVIESAQPALVVGVTADEISPLVGIVSLPAGFDPTNEYGGERLPDIVSQHAHAMTSGGSTGTAKVIVETSLAQCDPEVAVNAQRLGSRTLVPGPLYHAGPFLTGWQSLLHGGTVVVMLRFDAEECLRWIEGERIDWVLFVPTMMQRIWKLPEEIRNKYDVSSLERVASSGAPSPQWLKRAWIEWLGPDRIIESYGGSERIGGTSITGQEWLDHPGSVGTPLRNAKMAIRNEDGVELSLGDVGLVYFLPEGGAGSTYVYRGDAKGRRTNDGWETLGDLGYMDADGYLYLTGRDADMIVSGGANIYPAQIEAAIDQYPSVRSSAVIGLPHEGLGQSVYAIVDAPDGFDDDEMRDHLRVHLSANKIPRTFEHFDSPLRDDAGKVRRAKLREERM